MTLKRHLANIFFENYVIKCHEKTFKIVGTMKELIFIIGPETGF
jgi:hypothetical protein